MFHCSRWGIILLCAPFFSSQFLELRGACPVTDLPTHNLHRPIGPPTLLLRLLLRRISSHIHGGIQSSVPIDGGNTYTDVYTITENDEVDPVNDPSDYGSESISREMYSKNVGLVYRDLTLWEQQPNPSGNPPNITYDPFRIGFGMKMWMVDHN